MSDLFTLSEHGTESEESDESEETKENDFIRSINPMSAFLQSDAHIATLAYFVHRNCGTAYSREEIAQILLDENIRSLVTRYGEEEKKNAHLVRINAVRMEATPEQVLKMIAGYCYQACEPSDWEETEAHHIMKQLRDKMIFLITDSVDHEFWALK